MKKIVLLLLSVLILAGCIRQNDDYDELLAADQNDNDPVIEVIEDEIEFIEDEEIIVIESTSVLFRLIF